MSHPEDIKDIRRRADYYDRAERRRNIFGNIAVVLVLVHLAVYGVVVALYIIHMGNKWGWG